MSLNHLTTQKSTHAVTSFDIQDNEWVLISTGKTKAVLTEDEFGYLF